MSASVTGTCPHGKTVFIWLPDGPWYGDPASPDYGRYPWVHSAPVGPSRLQVCGLMPFAASAEAGTACYGCGHDYYRHEAPSGPLVLGVIRDPGRCADCGCDRMRYAPVTVAEYDPDSTENRLIRGEAVPGARGACTREGCAHSKLHHKRRRWEKPVSGQSACCRCPGWTDEPGAVMPPEPAEQLTLFGDAA